MAAAAAAPPLHPKIFVEVKSVTLRAPRHDTDVDVDVKKTGTTVSLKSSRNSSLSLSPSSSSRYIAVFPDTESQRALKHVQELHHLALSHGGAKGALLFLIQRSDCRGMAPSWRYDPLYSAVLRRAMRVGLPVYAVRVGLGFPDGSPPREEPLRAGVYFLSTEEVDMDWGAPPDVDAEPDSTSTIAVDRRVRRRIQSPGPRQGQGRGRGRGRGTTSSSSSWSRTPPGRADGRDDKSNNNNQHDTTATPLPLPPLPPLHAGGRKARHPAKRSGYHVFLAEKSEELRQRDPNMAFGDITRRVAEAWALVPDGEKKDVWTRRARTDGPGRAQRRRLERAARAREKTGYEAYVASRTRDLLMIEIGTPPLSPSDLGPPPLSPSSSPSSSPSTSSPGHVRWRNVVRVIASEWRAMSDAERGQWGGGEGGATATTPRNKRAPVRQHLFIKHQRWLRGISHQAKSSSLSWEDGRALWNALKRGGDENVQARAAENAQRWWEGGREKEREGGGEGEREREHQRENTEVEVEVEVEAGPTRASPTRVTILGSYPGPDGTMYDVLAEQ